MNERSTITRSTTSRLPAPLSDVALLTTRLLIGAVLVAHGLQKLGQGVGGVADGFAGMGIPLPLVSALFIVGVEIVGGVLLIAGAATAVAGLATVVAMAGAFLFAHFGTTVFVDDGGWELVGVIAAGALALAAAGPGRFSVDRLLAGRGARTEVGVSG
ncbi:putative oxidoreductase [Pseudonocardia ammonioxydans]|uniref:Putative oxidoreductase n=1 Tax=Pseudonocardia ammonioxydans TaxID=260086 RepID=A0A1I5EPK9_PSUAM|nr:DoxX family protein [Pseudonocardia ammonioxydans]SFO13293.1 putative oxidoreductase [Pseudonocardia ammonioxydans]